MQQKLRGSCVLVDSASTIYTLKECPTIQYFRTKGQSPFWDPVIAREPAKYTRTHTDL